MNLPNIEQLKLRLTGTRPLLLCRGDGANPFDPQAREIKRISQKKKKTDEDHELLAKLQFFSAAYYDEKIGMYIPTDNLLKCCQEGAAKYNESMKVKTLVVIKGFIGKELDSAAAKIIYKGPADLEGLYEDKQFVFLKMGKPPSGRARILTSRPIFHEWALEILVEYTEIEKSRMLDYWTIAGRLAGLGTWRPQHGLFTVEVIK